MATGFRSDAGKLGATLARPQENFRMVQLYASGDAARHPVGDTLHAALLVVAEQFGDLRRTPEGFDQSLVFFHGVRPKNDAHDVIKHHV